MHLTKLSCCILAAIPLFAQAQAGTRPESGQAATTSTTAGSAPARAVRSQGPQKTLQTVVVTAEKRQQDVQKVPASVTVLDSAKISQLGIRNVEDLNNLAPDLVVTPSAGSQYQAQIAMRGSAQVNPAPYWNSPVPIYVDGVYYGKSTGGAFDISDISRIEVLHGPQGTLYGQNAYAGAINVVTHKPSGVFNGRAEVDVGNYNGKVGKFSLDLPAIGKLYASVGGRIQRQDGWLNTTPGSSVSQMNNTHNQSGFMDLLFNATPRLSIEYRLDQDNVNQASRFSQVIQSDLEQIFGIPGVVPVAGRQTYGGVNGPINETMDRTGQMLHVDWQLDSHNTLKYIGGHTRMRYTQGLDLDGTILPIAGTQYDPFDYVLTSNELQLVGQDGPFNWVAGLYHFNDHGFVNNPQTFFFGADNYNSKYGFATVDRAAYGQLGYKPTDRLTLTLGVRRTLDKTTGYRSESGGGIDIPPVSATTVASAWTSEASISYQMSRNVLAYARYASGFQSGGFNGEAITTEAAITPFLPERKNSYEAGLKSTLFHDRLRLNGDVFYERNSDLQESVFTAKGSASSNIVNVGSSHDEGIELDAQALVGNNLHLGANYSYLHEQYSKFMELGENVADNRAVVFAPHNVVSLYADATLARTALGNWHAMLDYRYSTSYYQYAYQLQLVDPTQQLAANTRIPAGGVLNARIDLADMDWGSNVNGEIALWVRNLTNSDKLTGSIDFGPGFGNLIVGYPMNPRTYGVSLIATW